MQTFDRFHRLSVVGHLHECKPARQPGVTIHDDMDLLHPSVGFEQPPKLLVRHLRTQVSDKEVFHDVSPTGSFLIVGSCRAIRQEDEVEMDEVERSERPCFCLSAPPSPVPYV